MRHNSKAPHRNICMVTIYEDYGDEPEDQFIPLPEQLSCSFYDLEMEDYSEDIIFFRTLLPRKASILELGCGSGRVARALSSSERVITGIDISYSMLEKAQQHSCQTTRFVAMNMTNISFTCLFDAILIPYNSLNLLISKENIIKCLVGCRKHLLPGKQLIAQIFIPTQKFIRENKKTFQFQVFDTTNGDRLIKEILKVYHPDSQTISVEERYRFRPKNYSSKRADYNSCFSVAAYSRTTWQEMFKAHGFQIESCYEDFNKTPIGNSNSSSLVIVCN